MSANTQTSRLLHQVATRTDRRHPQFSETKRRPARMHAQNFLRKTTDNSKQKELTISSSKTQTCQNANKRNAAQHGRQQQTEGTRNSKQRTAGLPECRQAKLSRTMVTRAGRRHPRFSATKRKPARMQTQKLLRKVADNSKQKEPTMPSSETQTCQNADKRIAAPSGKPAN